MLAAQPMRVTQISKQTLRVTMAMLAGLGIVLPPSWAQRLAPPSEGHVADEWVSSAELDEMYQAAVRLSGRTDLGLLMASSPALARHSPFLMLVVHAPSFGEALDNLLKFSALSQEDCELTIGPAADPEHLAIRLSPNHVSPLGMVCRADFLMQGLVHLIRQADGSGASIIGIRLAFPPPPHAPAYGQHLGLVPMFEAPSHELIVTRRLMSQAMPMADAVEYQHALARAHIALAEHKQRRGWIHEVEALLLQSLSTTTDSAELARQMGTTDRTLRRQLAMLGTSYQAIRAQCQQTQACHLLAAGEHSIQQVASMVGFVSVPAFYRAFKRWTGQAPGTWVKGLGNAPTRPSARHNASSSA